ncbi:MAG: T9SS type A sorting domain-containing protein, partial [Bacteroidia bacterium]|nr:T9SS type A sorting domain-containing protein [Bacteroidia bacterium]
MKRKITLIVVCLFACNFIYAQTWSALGSGIAGNQTYVNAIAFYNGEIYAGGQFDSAGGNPIKGIARWNGTTWSDVGGGVSGVLGEVIFDLAVYNGELYAGGLFDTAGGVPANNIAKWNGISWSSLGAGVDYYVFALLNHNGELYVGGDFNYSGSIFTNGIAKWNGVSWDSLGIGVGPGVRTLAVYNGELYAGGWNMIYLGSSIGKWNGTTWSVVGGGIGGDVNDLCVYNGELYAGGWFAYADTTLAWNIARWNGSTWSALGGYINDAVNALAVYNGQLYAGGTFWEVDTSYINGIAKYNGTTWSAVGTGIESTGSTQELCVINSGLYVGGGFGGQFAPGNKIAKWGAGNCSANFTLFPDTSQPHTYWLADNSAGAAPLSYLWYWGDGNWDTIPYPTHTYDSAGFYSICLGITDNDGCSHSYCISYNLMRMDANNQIITVTVIPTGIPENNSYVEINFFPNPATNQLTISNTQYEMERVEIYDVLGQLALSHQPPAKSQQQITIDVSSLPSGIYFVS